MDPNDSKALKPAGSLPIEIELHKAAPKPSKVWRPTCSLSVKKKHRSMVRPVHRENDQRKNRITLSKGAVRWLSSQRQNLPRVLELLERGGCPGNDASDNARHDAP